MGWLLRISAWGMLGTTILFLRAPLLTGFGEFLVVRDPVRPADSIVLLAGEFVMRPQIAAEVFNAGMADRILIAQVKKGRAQQTGLLPDSTLLQIRMLEKFGIPQSSICVLNRRTGVTSTYEEALSVRRYLEDRPRQQGVILVTSEFHTRRAKWIFSKVLSDLGIDIQVAPAPYEAFSSRDWWLHEDGVIHCYLEYAKLGLYLLQY